MSIVLETLIRHFEREPNAVMWPNGIALRHGEIAAVLRHHALPVADRLRELEAQLAASEPVACSEKRHIQIHKSATLTPATENAIAVFFSDDWYSVGKDGYVCRIHSVDRASADSLNTLLNEEVDEHHPYRVLRVALVDESAHPSAAAVRVTDAMVEAVVRFLYRHFDIILNRDGATKMLTAALQTAASEGASA